MKKKINVLISHSGNNFCAQSDQVSGCYATSKDADELKIQFKQTVDFYLDSLAEDNEKLPFAKDGYELEFSYTTEALLQAYKDKLPFSALSKITGINQSLISHYANGIKKPRKKQSDRILTGFHEIGKELCALR